MGLAAALPAIIGAAGSVGGGLLASRQPSSVKNALNADGAYQLRNKHGWRSNQ